MLTFLYCLDENYNTQSIVSLSSLLNNVSKKITGVLKTFSSEKLLEKNFVDLI